jgi:hypothetical protein
MQFRVLLSSASRSQRKMPMTGASAKTTWCILQRRCFSRTTRTCSNSNNSNDSSRLQMKEPLRPYSGSLPSPGYEWCSRCNIPSRKLQKAIGQPNPCLDRRPSHASRGWLFFLEGVCPAARHYYQQQITYMFFFTALCFVALPGDFLPFGSHDDDDDEDVAEHFRK